MRFVGRGNNGAVFLRGDGKVVKWTTDPMEVAAWLAVRAMTTQGHTPPGLPLTDTLHVGHRAAVLVREDVAPLSGPDAHRAFPPPILDALHRGSLYSAAGSLLGQPTVTRRGQRLFRALLPASPVLRPVLRGLRSLAAFGVVPSDLRESNLGAVRNTVVLHDPGRTGLEAMTTGASEAYGRCPNVEALTRDVESILKRGVNYTGCKVVNRAQLGYVMRSHGWSATEVNGTAGFRSTDGKLWLRQGDEWALLHELVHAAGINADALATWWVEGLTEAVAQDVAKTAGRQHTPTYPAEVRLVRDLAHRLGTTPVSLGQTVAGSPDRVTKDLAGRLAALTGAQEAQWWRTMQAGGTREQAERLLRGGHAARGVPGRGADWRRAVAGQGRERGR